MAWHLEQKRRKADECPGCSGALSETTHPDSEGLYEGQVVRCHRCKARSSAVTRMGDDPDRASLLVYTVKDDG